MLFVLGACKKNDDTPITIGFKGLSTLLNKAPEKIQKSSPGIFDTANSTPDRLYFDYKNHPTLGNVEIFYKINNGLCDLVCLYPENNTLEVAFNLIELSEKEFKRGFTYCVIYHTKTTKIGQYLNSFKELKEYIAEKELTTESIDYIEAKYKYKGKIFYVGAMTYEGVFLPFSDMEIEKKENAIEKQRIRGMVKHEEILY